MKKRNPIITYLFLCLSCGVYLFYWLFITMKEINIIEGKIIFDVKKKLIILFSILIPEFIVLLIFQYYTPIFKSVYFGMLYTIGSISGLSWLAMIIAYYAQLGKSVGQLEVKYNIDRPTTGGKAVLFFFLWFTVIPYLQSHKNKLIDRVN